MRVRPSLRLVPIGVFLAAGGIYGTNCHSGGVALKDVVERSPANTQFITAASAPNLQIDLSKTLIFSAGEWVDVVPTAADLEKLFTGTAPVYWIYAPMGTNALVTYLPVGSSLIDHLNRANALLETPRSEPYTLEELSGRGFHDECLLENAESPTLGCGFSGGLLNETESWPIPNPRHMREPVLQNQIEYLGLRRRTFQPALNEEFLSNNLSSESDIARKLGVWMRQMPDAATIANRFRLALNDQERLKALLPPFFATHLNRWSDGPFSDCVTVATLGLYPEMNQTPLQFVHPMLEGRRYLEEVARPNRPMAGALSHFEGALAMTANRVFAGAAAEGRYFTPTEQISTGTVLEMIEVPWNRPNIHVMTVLGVYQNGSTSDILILEKENGGAYPTVVNTLENALARWRKPGKEYAIVAHAPSGEPVPASWLPPPPASCAGLTQAGVSGVCVEGRDRAEEDRVDAEGAPLPDVQQMCASARGVFSHARACPTAGRIFSCVIPERMTITAGNAYYRYYAPTSREDAAENCRAAGGIPE